MKIEYTADPFEGRPEPAIERFEETTPFTRHESETGANADHHVWPLEFGDSRWFDHGEIIRLDPGEYTDYLTYEEAVDGPVERYYRVFEGSARLHTETWDEQLDRFDAVFVPTECPHQIGNNGTSTLWLGSFASFGDNDPALDHQTPLSERTGAVEEYQRVLSVREAHDLPTPPRVTPDEGSDLETKTEPSIRRFEETIPVTFHEAQETGCNADRQEWFIWFPESEWFYAGDLLRLDPGQYIDFHSHRENEGPYEELFWVIEGTAHLQTEFWDTTLNRFDCAHFPTGSAHNFGNAGDEPLWFDAWVSHGGEAPEFNVHDLGLEPVERPGAIEEYHRIMAARKKRGLPLPPDVEVDLQGEAADDA